MGNLPELKNLVSCYGLELHSCSIGENNLTCDNIIIVW